MMIIMTVMLLLLLVSLNFIYYIAIISAHFFVNFALYCKNCSVVLDCFAWSWERQMMSERKKTKKVGGNEVYV
jgi:hypothetical protein